VIEPPGIGEALHQIAAGCVHGLFVRFWYRADMLGRPIIEILGECAVPVVEERPVQVAAVRHQSPSNFGWRFSIKAR
jgi:hypothetical protein